MNVLRIGLLLGALCAGCSGGSECGAINDAGDSPLSVTASGVGESFSYENFTSSPNNDCPAGGTTVVSVTVGGTQVGTGFPITFCLPRPDRIESGTVSLADATMIQLVDASARGVDGCTYALDAAAVPTGTVVFAGFCTKVGNRYHMSIAGSMSGTQTCAGDAGSGVPVTVTLTLSGTATVEII